MVMNFDEVVLKRRSIRKYQDKKVAHEDIEKMIASAILAPSWKNAQTARYYIVESEEMLAKIKREGLPEFNAYNCQNAAVLLVATFIKGYSGYNSNGEAANELHDYWGAYDLGLHNENLILKATDLGLGTLIIGIRNGDKIRELLNIPTEEVVVSVISIGYPDIEPTMPKRKEIQDIVKYY
jgi:nitroreductase